MQYHTVPWRIAKDSDPAYKTFVNKRRDGYGYPLLDRIAEGPREVLYKIIDPNARTRWNIEHVVKSEWVQHVDCCIVSERGVFHAAVKVVHDHSEAPETKADRLAHMFAT